MALSRNTVVLFVLSLCSSGCFVGGSENQQETEAYVAEEHLHHELPAHMPHDFPDAVREIEHRVEHLLEDLDAGHLDHAQRALSELLDIIGWLPELAADSDFNKQEWEQVRDGARILETIYQPLQDPNRVQEFLDNRRHHETVATILTQLEVLAEKYPDGFEPVLGGHDHDHHDHDH